MSLVMQPDRNAKNRIGFPPGALHILKCRLRSSSPLIRGGRAESGLRRADRGRLHDGEGHARHRLVVGLAGLAKNICPSAVTASDFVTALLAHGDVD